MVFFKPHHCVADVVGCGLDVVGCRRADIRVAKDSLNHHLRDSQAVQVAPELASRSVPAVPLRNCVI